MAELVLSRGGAELLRVPVEGQRFSVGSGPGADLCLPEPSLAPVECVLLRRGRDTVLARGDVERPLTEGESFPLGPFQAVFRAVEIRAHTRATVTAPDAGGETRPLVLRDRRAPQRAFRLDGSVITVGALPESALVVEDPFVSGRHCTLVRSGRGWTVEDTSRNGTWLDGVKVRHAELVPGAVLRIGQTELLVDVDEAREGQPVPGLIAGDPAMRPVMEWIHRVAPSSGAVAIEGESGTGKEVVARAVHELSPRRARAFVPVNCAAIAEGLWESELFGHERGSFTGATGTRAGAFEEADGGTLFLDEVGELPLEAQAKLLRALESGEVKRVGSSRPIQVDVRIIAATNRDLRREVEAGRFREDLFYRLYVLPVRLPPLRERKGDVLPLAEHFLARLEPAGRRHAFTAAARARLFAHGWPGNARELRNVVQRALCLARSDALGEETLVFDPAPRPAEMPRAPAAGPSAPGPATLAEIEKRAIEDALRRHGGNRSAAAKELGLSRATMTRKIKEHKLN